MTAPHLLCYECADAPKSMRYVVRFAMVGLKGHLEAHPVIFHGSDRAAVTSRAKTWMTAQLAKAKKKSVPNRGMAR